MRMPKSSQWIISLPSRWIMRSIAAVLMSENSGLLIQAYVTDAPQRACSAAYWETSTYKLTWTY